MTGIDNICSMVVLNWPQIACWMKSVSSSKLYAQLKINPPSIGIWGFQNSQLPSEKVRNEVMKAIQNKSRMMR